MELKKSSSPFFIVSAITSGLIFLFGVWWLYLIFKLSDRLSSLNVTEDLNIGSLIKWEGTTFLVLILVLVVSHTLLFIRDQRKNRSITAFFAGLTHELKTPLASIKLQSEVIKDEVDGIENQRLEKLTNRLIEDTIRLENQMDKILQLSRLERGGNLNFVDVDITHFIANIVKSDYSSKLNVELEDGAEEVSVSADEFALSIIFKNLLENTISHTNSKDVSITITTLEDKAIITYQDKGTFNGEINKLGNLFYKHESTKGSGIGLYLSRKLISRMHGSLDITKENGLIFKISLPLSKAEEENE
ncbi:MULTISPECIES: sensor histidine kinase [Halobacteriovorax]|uniref:histidine kinase n=1 Tax=Halobacteriovorax vibrionivorans TaxID=2152716 RepID=A0ABY0IGW6_9BACT|nr:MULTISPECIES: HAMP domain-containing sensor histidine kinase [Halobacteriovorax]RZF21076.1 HAMP domain-containing histidine kinase [Halobacteriovorax vibrionivorans]TGD47038.1 HAMP domain-containing histidine kinase [Halobacteriovorax sp. Y22]